MTTYPIYGDPGEGKEFVCYGSDIPKRNADGTVVTDVNGNIIYLYRADDLIITADGKPLTRDIERRGPIPNVSFRGIKDTSQFDLTHVSNEELVALSERVLEEKTRRWKANPTTVVRL